ncbi:MAG: hypothetical protein CMK56_00940 [Proteobacteria bacterium]|nr:hypothetical protein [Pseudomonadota bacterium]
MKLKNFAFFPPLDEPKHHSKRDFIERMKVDFPQIDILAFNNETEVLEKIEIVEAGYDWIEPKAIQKAQKLKWLANPDSGGFVNESAKDGWFYQQLIEHPVLVTNPRGIYSDFIGQHVMAYILTLSNRLPDYIEAQRNRLWHPEARRHKALHLRESKVMIVGAGGIGQEVARLCKGFNAHVLGVDPKFKSLENFDQILYPSELKKSVGEIDILVATVMHTPETHNLFNIDIFKKMKQTSIFINIGRGKTTVLDDLIYAIETNLISGAGLDVYEEEPLPKNHKLWTTRGVIMTPHVALMDSDQEITNRRYQIIKMNIERYNRGEELHNLVNKNKWY